MTIPVLRETTEADAPVILHILREAFKEYHGKLDPPSGVQRETVESIRDRMQTAGWVLAVAGGEPVGCVMYEPGDGFMYLGRLAVLPAYRREGIGQALIDRVEARARAAGLTRVRLGARIVLPQLRARYERQGYRFLESHTHPGYAEPTYEIFEKHL